MKSKIVAMIALSVAMSACGSHDENETYDGRPMDELISSLTVEQKVNIVMGTRRGDSNPPEQAPGMPDRQFHDPIEDISQGRIKGAAADGYSIDSLHIPSVIYADGPAGLRIAPVRENDSQTYYCTAFPTGTSLAASWDVEAIERIGAAIGEEVLEYGVDILLAPALNIHRTPLCGRNFEYYSEDPLLAGDIASAYTKGVQSNGVGVSLKHFAVNNQETLRNGVDAQVSERALREIYLKGFERVVRQAKPWTIMSSYNKVNGILASEHEWMLTDVLRGEWGFDGVVMTDWWAEENGARQQAAGNDLLMPGTQRQYDEILEGLEDGTLTMGQLDRNVANILKMIEKTPSFRGYAFSNDPDLQGHAQLSRMQAADGMVLLENHDDALPLKQGTKVALFGNAGYDTYVGGTGSGNVNRRYTVNIDEGLASAGFEVYAPLADSYRKYISDQKALHEAASFWALPDIAEMPLCEKIANEVAESNDVFVFVLSRMAGEGGDRELVKGDYYLSDVERTNMSILVRSAHEAGKKAVLLLNMGNMVEFAWDEDEFFDAVLHTWLPGQEAGNAIADILSGKVSPSGKLPFTWAENYADYPSAVNFPLSPDSDRAVRYEEDIFVGYRYFDTKDVKVLYPFGYGLSYAEFEYSGLHVKRGRNSVEVSLDVKNTGLYSGREAVQIYVSVPSEIEDRPKKELKAFKKTEELAPGASCSVTFSIPDADLAIFDENSDAWILPEGKYALYAAASVSDIRETAEFSVK